MASESVMEVEDGKANCIAASEEEEQSSSLPCNCVESPLEHLEHLEQLDHLEPLESGPPPQAQVEHFEHLEHLEHLEQLDHLDRLEHLDRLDRLEQPCTAGDSQRLSDVPLQNLAIDFDRALSPSCPSCPPCAPFTVPAATLNSPTTPMCSLFDLQRLVQQKEVLTLLGK